MRIKAKRKFLILIISSLVITTHAGCSSLAPLVASETPAPTETRLPTETPLPTVTATSTKASPPLDIWGCLYAEACNSAYNIRDYFRENDALTYNVQYPVTVYTENEVWFFYQWCAVDSITLDQNLQELEFEFTIDDVSYADGVDQGYVTVEDPAIPSDSHPCYSIGATLSGWKDGTPHKVTIGARVLADVYDGWRTNTAGDYFYVFMINPTGIATPVPPTLTPTPTITPKPGQPSDCGTMGFITIGNFTGGLVIVTLSGPTTYTFTAPDRAYTKFCVMGGTYTYVAESTVCTGTISGSVASEGGNIRLICR